MIGIIDYGSGNLRSIKNMLQRAGINSIVSSEPEILRQVERLILPGVGNFSYGMEQLRQRGLIEVLNERVQTEKVPFLGICLGGQLIGRHSQEGDSPGLGWVEMDVVAFDRARLGPHDKVPHMGWAESRCGNHPLFDGMPECPPRFYYVHSFHFAIDDHTQGICEATHGYSFVSGVAVGNVIGVQFHPEKSHAFGCQLLKNWVSMEFPRS